MKLCVDVDYSFPKAFFQWGVNLQYFICAAFVINFIKMYRLRKIKCVCVSHVLCFNALKNLYVLCVLYVLENNF